MPPTHVTRTNQASSPSASPSATPAGPGGTGTSASTSTAHRRSSGTPVLQLTGIVHRYGERVVLDGLDLVAAGTERLGLVGENGVGKSTLLRLAAGVETPDAGQVLRHGSTGLLPQQVAGDPTTTVADLLASATADLDALADRLGRVSDLLADPSAPDDEVERLLAEYGRLVDEQQRRDVWSAPARLDAALAAFGVSALPRSARLATLSGGQRSRLALAALLVRRPTILLLDEPTTHLDDAAVTHLEAQVRTWPGPVVLASHDRALLDAVCTAVVDLDPARAGGGTRYGGGYSEYLRVRVRERRRWERGYRDWVRERERLTLLTRPENVRVGHADRDRRDGDKSLANLFAASSELAVARRVKDARERLRRLVAAPVPRPPDPLRFHGSWRAGAGEGVLLSVRDVDVPGRVRAWQLEVRAGTRLLVTGPNGSGKSSLLAVLAGTLPPGRGTRTTAPGTRVGLLAQDTHWPDPAATVVTAFAGDRTGDVDHHVRALLDLGLLRATELRRRVGDLSVGQQRRVALARLVVDDPEVLLLDEPTDHLSLALVEELEEALGARGGPVVVVSHDRWLRRRWDGETADIASLR